MIYSKKNCDTLCRVINFFIAEIKYHIIIINFSLLLKIQNWVCIIQFTIPLFIKVFLTNTDIYIDNDIDK